jgi:hypothetical protein
MGNSTYPTALQIPIASSAGAYSNFAAAGDTVINTLSGNLILQTGAGNSGIYINTSNNIGIGISNRGALVQITNPTVAITYVTQPTLSISDGPVDNGPTYGMVNLTRPSNVTDNKGNIAFIRAGSLITSIGYLQRSNTIVMYRYVRGNITS